MTQSLLGTNPSRGVQIHAPRQELHGLLLLCRERAGGAVAAAVAAAGGPEHDLLEGEALGGDGGDGGVEHAAVQLAGEAHALAAEDGGDLDHGLDVVGAVEEGEALAEHREQDHAGRPDVDLGRLLGALEEDLGRAEAARAGAVGAARGPRVLLGEAGLLARRVQRVEGDGLLQAVLADLAVLVAEAGLRVRALALREAEVDEHAALLVGVVEEVGGLDVAVDDAPRVHGGEGGEEGAQVDARVVHVHSRVVFPEILVPEVGQDEEDLVGLAEGGDEGAYGGGCSQVVEKLEFVEDAGGRGSDVDLLDGDELRLPARRSGRVIQVRAGRGSERRRRPLAIVGVDVPAVDVVVVADIFGLVYS